PLRALPAPFLPPRGFRGLALAPKLKVAARLAIVVSPLPLGALSGLPPRQRVPAGAVGRGTGRRRPAPRGNSSGPPRRRSSGSRFPGPALMPPGWGGLAKCANVTVHGSRVPTE